MKARLLLRHLFRFVGDQGAYSVRTGAWWIPVATVILGIVVVAAATFQVVVPHAVYVFSDVTEVLPDPWSLPPPQAAASHEWIGRAVAAGIVGAASSVATVKGQGGFTSSWAIWLLVTALCWSLLIQLAPKRPIAVPVAMAAVAIIGDQLVSPTTGHVAFGIAIALTTSLHVGLLGASVRLLRSTGHRDGAHPLALGMALAASTSWPLLTAEAVTVSAAALALASAVFLPAWGQQGLERLLGSIIGALEWAVAWLAKLALLVAVLPIVYLPGAVARLFSALTQRSRNQPPAWQPTTSAARRRNEARRPFRSPPRKIVVRRNLSGLVVIGLLAGLLIAAPWEHEAKAPNRPGVPLPPDSRSLADRLDDIRYQDRPATAGLPYADQLQEETRQVRLVPNPELGYQLSNSTGRYLNVIGHKRATVAPSCTSCPTKRVWLVGGSLVFGVGERDQHTVASQLVARAEAEGISLEVLNMGVPGYTLEQQTKWVLKELTNPSTKRPDLVVLLDGYNDTMASLMEYMVNGKLGPNQPTLDPDRADQLLSSSGDLAKFDGAAVGRASARRYQRGLEALTAQLEKQKIDVIRFFQPDASSSDRQRRAVLALGVLPADFFESSQMDETLEAAATTGQGTINLRGSLQDLQRPVFLDTSHVNEFGAAVMAKAMWPPIASALEGAGR